jgi:hypothetical protein
MKKKKVTTKVLLYTMLMIYKHYLTIMIFISKGEKVPVKEVLNIQLLLPRILHPGAMLKRPTELKRLSTVVLLEGERRILPLRKLRVHTSYP